VVIFYLIFVCLAPRAWPWGNDGHEIVARIAAKHLSDNARSNVAQALGSASDADSVADAMASAATWPDTIKLQHPETKPCHFFDICADDTGTDLVQECTNRDCITAKIQEYDQRVQQGNFDNTEPRLTSAF
jgi:hypothetical protein